MMGIEYNNKSQESNVPLTSPKNCNTSLVTVIVGMSAMMKFLMRLSPSCQMASMIRM